MKSPKHSGWTAHPDDSHTAKIGRTKITIYPPRSINFWRGDHKGEPCYTAATIARRTVAFHGSHSGCAFTLEGAKALALWVVLNDLTGRTPPDSVFPKEELDDRLVWDAAVDYVNATYGEN